jgi:hypothetical protein
VHFDGNYFTKNVKSFEKSACYLQKWQRSDTTLIQITSTILPNDLKIFNNVGVVKSIPFTNVGTASLGVIIYHCLVDFSGVVDGIYQIEIDGKVGLNEFQFYSEPIYLKDLHENTLLFRCFNLYNDFGVIFTTNYQIYFRCEAAIMEMEPKHERAAFIDEIHDIKTLSATPYREHKLKIGDAPGVAPWVIDLLNRIFSCSFVEIEGLEYGLTDGAKWTINRQRNYAMIGAEIEIGEGKNLYTQQINSGATSPGIVTGYDLNTNFFGPTPEIVHVTKIETI